MVEASRATGRGRKPRWPLAVVWLVAAGDLAAAAVLPHSAARTYDGALFGISVGCLIVMLVYARGLRTDKRRATARTVLLLGGPCDGHLLLDPGELPAELWLAGADESVCAYRISKGRPSGPRTMLYQRTDVGRRVPGL